MSNSRTHSQGSGRDGRLKSTARQGHNGQHVPEGDKPDQRIVALVKLLARLAAEKDFCDEPHER
jgi:hypothetical protein